MMSLNPEGGENPTPEPKGGFHLSPEIRAKVDSLVLLSKKNGFVTVQDINEVIPDSATDPDLIEYIMITLDSLGVVLLDEDEIETYRKAVRGGGEAEGELALTQEQELECFKEIEDCEMRAQYALFDSWLTLPYQLDLAMKVLRKEEPFDKVVIGKRVESEDLYYRILPKVTEDCSKLKAKLDLAWARYLETPELSSKVKCHEAYRKMEMAVKDGCKDVLRKFRFKMSLMESWLNRPDISEDYEDARYLVEVMKVSLRPSAGAPNGRRIYAKRAREIEHRWRMMPAELVRIREEVLRHFDHANRVKAKVVVRSLKLVISVAKEYEDRGLSFEDLVQQGNLGLMKAINEFEYRFGRRFADFATSWIRQDIVSSLPAYANFSGIPASKIEMLDDILKVKRQLAEELGRDPDPEEIANEMNIAIDVVWEILAMSKDSISLQTPEGRLLQAALGDNSATCAADTGSSRLLREKVDLVLRSLSEREREVLILRFGLIDGVTHTLEEVGRHFKVSRVAEHGVRPLLVSY
jgi:RNA polymerase primary sigma factor